MKRILAIAVLSLSLAVPAVAFANGDSSCASYNPPALCSVSAAGTSKVSGTTATASANAGTLPFTGLDLALLVAGGASLLAAGLVVRTISRRLD